MEQQAGVKIIEHLRSKNKVSSGLTVGARQATCRRQLGGRFISR